MIWARLCKAQITQGTSCKPNLGPIWDIGLNGYINFYLIGIIIFFRISYYYVTLKLFLINFLF